MAEGASEKVGDAGAGAVVGMLGGGVTEEEVNGAAEVAVVETEGPVQMADADTGQVAGPLGTADGFDDEGAEFGIGFGGGEGVSEGDGGGLDVRRHGAGDGFVAPAIGVFGACGGGHRS